VWIGAFTVAPASEARPAAREIDELGYDTLWYPEGLGTRESFANGAVLLAATERIRVASGIANIWGRDAVSAANAARVLADAFDDRFLLGLGVSHPRQVEPRGHAYDRPVARMSAFLDAMDDDRFVSPDVLSVTRPPVPRVLAALRPPMLRLAARKALGAHTYLVPVEHTRRARAIMGPDALLIPEQKVVCASDRGEDAGAEGDRLVPRHPELLRQPPVARVFGRRLRGRRLGRTRRRARCHRRRGGNQGASAGAPRRRRHPGRDPAARGRRPVRARDAPPPRPCATRLTRSPEARSAEAVA
jgi:probable F420-dependent oxidoreductase